VVQCGAEARRPLPQARKGSQCRLSVMKPPAFDYVRPQRLDEAVELLAAAGGAARVVAGGQSLLALMNLRLASPGLLIDIARLPELLVAAEDRDSVSLGAGLTHARIEDGLVPDPSRGLMAQVAANLAYRAIRNRGTIGGSLALADPAAEWPAVLATLDARASLRGPGGRRFVACAEFATGIFETWLAEDEIIDSIEIPKLSAEARWGYVKLARKSGEFAAALAVAVIDPARGYGRIVVGAANGPPLVLAEASRALAPGAAVTLLDEAIAADLDHAADRALDDFQQRLHRTAALRAAQRALA
jgi:aerobic carbon-monoxide dehydrogenase medium subunit